MRFLYKRPRMEDVSEELNALIDVMVSDTFVLVDLFIYSLIFTLLLSSVLASVLASVLFFCGCYTAFYCVYYFFFNRIIKKS